MRRELMFFAAAIAITGCAPTPEPRYVRLSELPRGPLDLNRPLVIEVEAGDTVPLDFSLQGPLFESPKDAPPIMLRAKRHFYLRIGRDGLRSSVDRNDFSGRPVKPGSFQIGFGVTKTGPLATVTIRTPTPPGITEEEPSRDKK